LGVYSGIGNQGYYSGEFNERATRDLVALFDEFREGAAWSASERQYTSKSVNPNTTVDMVLANAREAELEEAVGRGLWGRVTTMSSLRRG